MYKMDLESFRNLVTWHINKILDKNIHISNAINQI